MPSGTTAEADLPPMRGFFRPKKANQIDRRGEGRASGTITTETAAPVKRAHPQLEGRATGGLAHVAAI